MTEARLPRLLVIDDEAQVGRMLVRLLRRSHEVVAVTNAEEALALVRRETWHAILCDIMMPGTDGPAFFGYLERERPELVDRVGFMTGGVFDPEVRAFLEARGDEGWLAKPFTRRDLLTFVERLVERGGARPTEE